MLDVHMLDRMAPLYERVRWAVPPIEWPSFAEEIDAILRLKQERNAVILAHNCGFQCIPPTHTDFKSPIVLI